MSRLRQVLLATVAICGLAVATAATASASTASEKDQHCVESANTGTIDCFDTLAESLSVATGGAVNLTAADSGCKMRLYDGNTASGSPSYLIGIDAMVNSFASFNNQASSAPSCGSALSCVYATAPSGWGSRLRRPNCIVR